jgi:hypothetical protein
MSDGLKRVGKEVKAFSSKVAQCRNEDNSDMSDIQDAYSRLIRARDRYLYEAKHRLAAAEKAALQKVFEDDKFIEGMGKVRGIADHVEIGEVIIRDTNNAPFTITPASSAAAVFADRCVNLTDVEGVTHRWDHLEVLTEADDRVTRALKNAKGS